MPKRIFVPRAADESNLNAQSQNARSIFSRWTSGAYRPELLTFSGAAQAVTRNPNVGLMRLPDNRLWRAALFGHYLRSWDLIFYPGIHHYADWLALRTRKLMGGRAPIVATCESLIGCADNDRTEQFYSGVAGHPVFCGKLPSAEARRYGEIAEMADHIVAISPFLGRMAAARYGNKVSVVPLGVETRLFERTSQTENSRPRVLGAGTVYALKRPEVFLRLARSFPEADFIWYGDGELRSHMLAEIARERLGNLQFPGAVSPRVLAQALQAADVFVLPSFAEGVPKVTQEAAAAGAAQIVFGFYEAPTVVDGENGFAVGSDEELIERLSQLVHDRALARRMGAAGMRMAQDWSWDSVALRWQAKLIELCS